MRRQAPQSRPDSARCPQRHSIAVRHYAARTSAGRTGPRRRASASRNVSASRAAPSSGSRRRDRCAIPHGILERSRATRPAKSRVRLQPAPHWSSSICGRAGGTRHAPRGRRVVRRRACRTVCPARPPGSTRPARFRSETLRPSGVVQRAAVLRKRMERRNPTWFRPLSKPTRLEAGAEAGRAGDSSGRPTQPREHRLDAAACRGGGGG